MYRFAAIAVVLLFSAGCRAPMPNWNMFSPYGATRVPPPPTGGYGTPQPYYSPAPSSGQTPASPTSSPVGTGFRPATINRWSNIDDPTIGPATGSDSWEPTRPTDSSTQVVDLRDLDVALANHETAVPQAGSTVIVEREGPIRILSAEPAGSTSEDSTADSPRLRGMVVNDLTRPAEPRAFVPEGRVIDISELPDAPPASRSATVQTSTGSASAGQAGGNGWQTRTTTLRVAGS